MRILIASALTVCFLTGTPLAAAQAETPKTDADCGRVIVKYRDAGRKSEASTQQLRQLQAAAGRELKYHRTLGNGAYLLTPGRPLADPPGNRAMIAGLRAASAVEYAECDTRRRIAQIPNDPYYATRQWYLFEAEGGIRAEQAWHITMGDNTVVTAIIDSGIRSHSDIDQTRLLDGYDFVSEDFDRPEDRFFTANDNDGRDEDERDPGDAVLAGECSDGTPEEDEASSWHGTRITGIVGAATGNGAGVTGIDWTGLILPVRAIGKCGGFISDISAAIRWAAGLSVPGVDDNPFPADVINLSLGASGSCDDTENYTERDAIQAAVDAGALVVVAAGNEFHSTSQTVPASCDIDGMVVVAATTRSGAETCYTNIGEEVDLSAPGGNNTADQCSAGPGDGIYSTSNAGRDEPAHDIYEYGAGTSFAVPMVAGAGALLAAVAPGLTPVQMETVLKDSTRDFPQDTDDGFGDCTTNECGTGILDINKALQTASGVDILPEPFLFDDRNGVEPDTLIESNAIIVRGIDMPVPVSIADGEYAVDGGAYTNSTRYVESGASITARVTSSLQYAQTITTTLNVGDVSGTFSVTTRDEPLEDSENENGGGGGGHPIGLIILLISFVTLRFCPPGKRVI